MRRSAAKVAARLLIAGLPLAATNVARADEVDQATERLISLDQRVHIMALEFNEAPRDGGDAPVRRVVDAQGLIGLGHTEEATTLLLDVAMRWPATPAGRDAAFLLADALYQLGDVRLARRYYEEALSKFTGTERERRALIRLVEIAISTRELNHVDRYLGMLSRTEAGRAALDPAVQYLEAKILFQRGDLDGAGRKFAAIAAAVPPASAFAWRSRYFAATVLVKKGDLAGALRTFEALTSDKPPDAIAREIQDLARLALGRIRYRQGSYDLAAASYRSLAADSKWSPDALYELGWTHVAGKRFDDAHAAFTQLLRTRPDGPRAPELKLLLANIDLRQGRLAQAQTRFASTRDELEPAYDKLREVIVRSQAEPDLLDRLTNLSHDEITLTAFVPESARNWVRADPEVERLLKLAGDVEGSQRMFAEAGEVLQRIEGALAEAARLDPLELFVDLRRTRQISAMLFAELSATRDRFTDRVRRLQAPYLDDGEAQRLRQLDAERAALALQLGATSKLEVAAIAPTRPPSIERDPRDGVGLLRALVLRLEGPRSDVHFGMAEAMRATNPALVSGARERAVADRLQRVTDEEHRIDDGVLERASPPDRQRLDRELGVASRAAAVMSQLFALDARLHAEAEVRLSTLQRLVADRRHDMAVTTGRLETVMRDAENLGDLLVRVMYTRVADRLYDLLVRADVGLIDVAWADKDKSTTRLHAVLQKKKREREVIDDDFMRKNDALDRRFKRALQLLGQFAADPKFPVTSPPAH